jgi:hypothetical protein
MEEPTVYSTSNARKPRSLRALLLIIALAFIAGISVMGWALSRWDAGRHWLLGTPQLSNAIPAIAVTPTLNPAIPAVSMTDTAQRLAQVEGRLATLEANTATGGGSSARAEGLLIAFAARRALDRGLALGYVEGMLSQHFGDSQPRAVATIIAASQEPATLDQLETGLVTLTPALSGSAPNQGWWEGFKQSVAGLFVVRKQGSTSPLPDVRLAQAQRLLENGRVDLALAEVARLPSRDKAAAWMAMARRNVEAHRALDLLEAAAITSGEQP